MDELYICWENLFQEHDISREFAAYYANIFSDNKVSIENLDTLNEKFLNDLNITEKDDIDLILDCVTKVLTKPNEPHNIILDVGTSDNKICGSLHCQKIQNEVGTRNMKIMLPRNESRGLSLFKSSDRRNIKVSNYDSLISETSSCTYQSFQIQECVSKNARMKINNLRESKIPTNKIIKSEVKQVTSLTLIRTSLTLIKKMILLAVQHYNKLYKRSTRFKIQQYIVSRFVAEDHISLLEHQLNINLDELVNAGYLKYSYKINGEDAYTIIQQQCNQINTDHKCNTNEKNYETFLKMNNISDTFDLADSLLSESSNPLLKKKILSAIHSLNWPSARDIFYHVFKQYKTKQIDVDELKTSVNETLLHLLCNEKVKCSKKWKEEYYFEVIDYSATMVTQKETNNHQQIERTIGKDLENYEEKVIQNEKQVPSIGKNKSLIEEPRHPVKIACDFPLNRNFQSGKCVLVNKSIDQKNSLSEEGNIQVTELDNQKENANKQNLKCNSVDENTQTKKLNGIFNKYFSLSINSKLSDVSMEDMILSAIQNNCNLQPGSTKAYIIKYITENYAIDINNTFTLQLHTALKKLVSTHKIMHCEGAIDTFRISNVCKSLQNKCKRTYAEPLLLEEKKPLGKWKKVFDPVTPSKIVINDLQQQNKCVPGSPLADITPHTTLQGKDTEASKSSCVNQEVKFPIIFETELPGVTKDFIGSSNIETLHEEINPPNFKEMVLTTIEQKSKRNQRCNKKDIYNILCYRYGVKTNSKFTRRQSTMAINELIQEKQISISKERKYISQNYFQVKKMKTTEASAINERGGSMRSAININITKSSKTADKTSLKNDIENDMITGKASTAIVETTDIEEFVTNKAIDNFKSYKIISNASLSKNELKKTEKHPCENKGVYDIFNNKVYSSGNSEPNLSHDLLRKKNIYQHMFKRYKSSVKKSMTIYQHSRKTANRLIKTEQRSTSKNKKQAENIKEQTYISKRSVENTLTKKLLNEKSTSNDTSKVTSNPIDESLLEVMIFSSIQKDYNLRQESAMANEINLRIGSTKADIIKSITDNYSVTMNTMFILQLNATLKKLISTNKIKCRKGIIDTFRIHETNSFNTPFGMLVSKQNKVTKKEDRKISFEKKHSNLQAKPSHPSYKEMVLATILKYASQQRVCSKTDIYNHIRKKYGVIKNTPLFRGARFALEELIRENQVQVLLVPKRGKNRAKVNKLKYIPIDYLPVRKKKAKAITSKENVPNIASDNLKSNETLKPEVSNALKHKKSSSIKGLSNSGRSLTTEPNRLLLGEPLQSEVVSYYVSCISLRHHSFLDDIKFISLPYKQNSKCYLCSSILNKILSDFIRHRSEDNKKITSLQIQLLMGFIDKKELEENALKTTTCCATGVSSLTMKMKWWLHFSQQDTQQNFYKKSENMAYIELIKKNSDSDQTSPIVKILKDFEEFHGVFIRVMCEKYEMTSNFKELLSKKDLQRKKFIEDTAMLNESLSATQKDMKARKKQDLLDNKCFICHTKFEKLFITYMIVKQQTNLKYSDIEAIVLDTSNEVLEELVDVEISEFCLLRNGRGKENNIAKLKLESLFICLPEIASVEISSLQNLWLYHFKIKHKGLYQKSMALDQNNLLPKISMLRMFNSYYYKRKMDCKGKKKELLFYHKVYKDIDGGMEVEEAARKYMIPSNKLVYYVNQRSVTNQDRSLSLVLELALVVYIHTCKRINKPLTERRIQQLALLLALENKLPLTELVKFISATWWKEFKQQYTVLELENGIIFPFEDYVGPLNLITLRSKEDSGDVVKNKLQYFEVLNILVKKTPQQLADLSSAIEFALK